jgi:hypothetical protein
MAAGTGQRPGFMLAGGPHGHFALVVTSQANGILFFPGLGRFRAQGKNTAALAFFSVSGARAVTGFAHKFLTAASRCSGISFDAVDVSPEACIDLFMTLHAGFIARKTFIFLAALRFRCQEQNGNDHGKNKKLSDLHATASKSRLVSNFRILADCTGI